jgi:hypothetical protein
MGEKFFDQLRNKEQYGYSVSCSQRSSQGVLGFRFLIQSSKFTPKQCEARILEWINTFEIEEDYYAEVLAGYIAKKKDGFKDSKAEFKHLEAILNTSVLDPAQKVQWDWTPRQIAFFENHCSLAQVVQMFNDTLRNNSAFGSYNVYCWNHREDYGALQKDKMQEVAEKGGPLSTEFFLAYPVLAFN